MHNSTIKRIEFLQDYMNRHHKKWLNRHNDNIVGFRIDKKNKKGRYAIIFQVKQKIEEAHLDKKNIIPRFYNVKFPDGAIKKIKTDIEETGTPQLHLAKCSKPLHNGNTEVGTVGVFLTDGVHNYGVTNYHVAAKDRMLDNQFFFSGNDNNIFIDNKQSVFTDGVFSNDIDVAFIQIPNSVHASNFFINGSRITGFINGPLSIQIKNKQVTIFTRNNSIAEVGVVNNNAAIFVTGFNNISMKELIQISPRLTQPGDSGSPVLINNAIMGIVVGGDNLYTYAVPFFKIRNFKPLQII
jgi:hypothetical protein